MKSPEKSKITHRKSNKKSLSVGASRPLESLVSLGLGDKVTDYPQDYSPQSLETFENKNPKSIAWTSFVCTEFTSLCPKTGQPDFAKIFVNYIADKKMVESKSMKLYLFSFRNHGGFHEDCVQTICNDLVSLLRPCYIEVIGEFTPRGGIAIYPFSQWAQPKAQFQKLLQSRLEGYSPGKYSIELKRLY